MNTRTGVPSRYVRSSAQSRKQRNNMKREGKLIVHQTKTSKIRKYSNNQKNNANKDVSDDIDSLFDDFLQKKAKENTKINNLLDDRPPWGASNKRLVKKDNVKFKTPNNVMSTSNSKSNSTKSRRVDEIKQSFAPSSSRQSSLKSGGDFKGNSKYNIDMSRKPVETLTEKLRKELEDESRALSDAEESDSYTNPFTPSAPKSPKKEQSDSDDEFFEVKPVSRLQPYIVDAKKQMEINKEVLALVDSSSSDEDMSDFSQRPLAAVMKSPPKKQSNLNKFYSPTKITHILNSASANNSNKSTLPLNDSNKDRNKIKKNRLILSPVLEFSASESLQKEQKEVDNLKEQVKDLKSTIQKQDIQIKALSEQVLRLLDLNEAHKGRELDKQIEKSRIQLNTILNPIDLESLNHLNKLTPKKSLTKKPPPILLEDDSNENINGYAGIKSIASKHQCLPAPNISPGENVTKRSSSTKKITAKDDSNYNSRSSKKVSKKSFVKTPNRKIILQDDSSTFDDESDNDDLLYSNKVAPSLKKPLDRSPVNRPLIDKLRIKNMVQTSPKRVIYDDDSDTDEAFISKRERQMEEQKMLAKKRWVNRVEATKSFKMREDTESEGIVSTSEETILGNNTSISEADSKSKTSELEDEEEDDFSLNLMSKGRLKTGTIGNSTPPVSKKVSPKFLEKIDANGSDEEFLPKGSKTKYVIKSPSRSVSFGDSVPSDSILDRIKDHLNTYSPNKSVDAQKSKGIKNERETANTNPKSSQARVVNLGNESDTSNTELFYQETTSNPGETLVDDTKANHVESQSPISKIRQQVNAYLAENQSFSRPKSSFINRTSLVSTPQNVPSFMEEEDFDESPNGRIKILKSDITTGKMKKFNISGSDTDGSKGDFSNDVLSYRDETEISKDGKSLKSSETYPKHNPFTTPTPKPQRNLFDDLDDYSDSSNLTDVRNPSPTRRKEFEGAANNIIDDNDSFDLFERGSNKKDQNVLSTILADEQLNNQTDLAIRSLKGRSKNYLLQTPRKRGEEEDEDDIIIENKPHVSVVPNKIPSPHDIKGSTNIDSYSDIEAPGTVPKSSSTQNGYTAQDLGKVLNVSDSFEGVGTLNEGHVSKAVSNITKYPQSTKAVIEISSEDDLNSQGNVPSPLPQKTTNLANAENPMNLYSDLEDYVLKSKPHVSFTNTNDDNEDDVYDILFQDEQKKDFAPLSQNEPDLKVQNSPVPQVGDFNALLKDDSLTVKGLVSMALNDDLFVNNVSPTSVKETLRVGIADNSLPKQSAIDAFSDDSIILKQDPNPSSLSFDHKNAEDWAKDFDIKNNGSIPPASTEEYRKWLMEESKGLGEEESDDETDLDKRLLSLNVNPNEIGSESSVNEEELNQYVGVL